MAAACPEQALVARAANECADIDPGERAGRAAAGFSFHSNYKGGFVEAILQAPGDDSDYAGMPSLAGHEQKRRVVLVPRQFHGFAEDQRFDGLPLAVVKIEHLSKPECLFIASRRKKRSEEHTSELQSRQYLVCRLLLEKK